MAISHKGRVGRKPSGGRYVRARKKRLFELGNEPALTKIGEIKKRIIKTKAAGTKSVLLSTNIANLFNPKSKEFSKVGIISVIDNPANRHYIRRNIITKGAIIQTEMGKARVTSRPGQDGAVNAVLIS
ncbi:MAG: 30S ribosomal protein S8e, partial [Candidatus Woesearchaeota archaeon]